MMLYKEAWDVVRAFNVLIWLVIGNMVQGFAPGREIAPPSRAGRECTAPVSIGTLSRYNNAHRYDAEKLAAELVSIPV